MQQLKNLLTSSRSIIGCTSLARSGKTKILSDLSVSWVSNKSIKEAWILDSRATDHMTPIKENFMIFTPLDKGRHVKTADGTLLPVEGIGTIRFGPIGLLTQVLYIPRLFVSLVSVQRLAKNKEHIVLFYGLSAFLCNKVHGWKIGLARLQQGLYFLPWEASKDGREVEHKVTALTSVFEGEIMRIHQRMGHPFFEIVKQMYPNLFKNVALDDLVCEACQLGKKKRTTYPISNLRCQEPFHLIHCGIWGPAPITDINAFRYFLICVDDFSRRTWVFLLKQKPETTKTLENFCKMIKRQFDTDIKGFRIDNARDFCNTNLKEFFESQGIRHETSCPYTPQQNGLGERKISDIMNKCRTLMIAENMPRNLWGFGVLTVVYLNNRVPTKVLNWKSPLEVLEAKFPNIQQRKNLKPRIFGCVGYVLSHDVNKDKLSPRAHRCVFIGYSNTQKGYKLYHPSTKRVFVSKDVTFDENIYFYSLQPKQSDLLLTDLPDFPTDKENDNNPLILESPIVHIDETRSEKGAPVQDVLMTDPSQTIGSDKMPLGSKEGELQFKHYPKFYERKKKKIEELMKVTDKELDATEKAPSTEEEIVESLNSSNSEIVIKDSGDNDEWPIGIRKGTRSCAKPLSYDIANYLDYQQVSPSYKCFLIAM